MRRTTLLLVLILGVVSVLTGVADLSRSLPSFGCTLHTSSAEPTNATSKDALMPMKNFGAFLDTFSAQTPSLSFFFFSQSLLLQSVSSSQVSPLTFRLASNSDTLVLASQCIAKELDALYRLQPVVCRLPLHLGPLAAVVRSDKPLSKAAATFLEQVKNAAKTIGT